MQSDFGLMLVRLFYAGPLLYLGLAMALDPAGFVGALANLARAIRNFEERLQGARWETPLPAASSLPVSAGTRAAFRIAGTALAIVALLHLVGILG